MGVLKRDDNQIPIQGFTPDPLKSIAPINLAGTKVFKEGAGGDYDITGWTAINIVPTVNITRYFNTDTTKTRTLIANQDNIILIHENVTKITISGTDPAVEVEGM